MNWIDYITKTNSAGKTLSFGFKPPITDSFLDDLKLEFNLNELPTELEELYRQTNGIVEWSYLDGQSKRVTLQSYVIKNNKATMA